MSALGISTCRLAVFSASGGDPNPATLLALIAMTEPLSRNQAAQLLRMSDGEIRWAIESGAIPTVRARHGYERVIDPVDLLRLALPELRKAQRRARRKKPVRPARGTR